MIPPLLWDATVFVHWFYKHLFKFSFCTKYSPLPRGVVEGLETLLEKAASGFIFQECKSFPFCDFRELIFHSIKTLWGKFSVILLSLRRLLTFGFFFLEQGINLGPAMLKERSFSEFTAL